MMLSLYRFKLSCMECDYSAFFECIGLARSAASMHRHLGKAHVLCIEDRSKIDGKITVGPHKSCIVRGE